MEHLQLTILFLIKTSVALNVYEYATFDYNQAADVNTEVENYKIGEESDFLKVKVLFLLNFSQKKKIAAGLLNKKLQTHL